jgi:Na+/H+ antiporter NhaC
LSAAFASLLALENGYTSAAIADAAIGGVTTAMSAIFILLAVGALIGTWNMASTIPTVVDYGVRLLNPTIFFLTTAAICAVVDMVTGNSWTTAGTLGVAFVGMAKVMGLSEATAAGAVSSPSGKVPPFLAILGSALFAGILACFTQWSVVKAFVDEPGRSAVEDSGTVTSVLVPWNTCGAYTSGVLGVSTASYFPYCFFNLASPILDVLYGFVGSRSPRPRRRHKSPRARDPLSWRQPHRSLSAVPSHRRCVSSCHGG